MSVVASSAAFASDHRDGPIFGPPGITITNSRRDLNDLYVFRSPANANNTVLILTVSPFSTATTPATFDNALVYDFKIATRDVLNVSDDITFRVTFGPPDGLGVQDVLLRGLPASRFPATSGILVRGKTRQNIPVNGGGLFRAGEQDDPIFFDAAGYDELLNNPTLVQAVVDGDYPNGTSPNGFGPGSTPNFDADNFFGPNVNTLAIALEIPSTVLGANGAGIAVWARTELDGVQVDRVGRPLINTAIVPPVPRGSSFPIDGSAPNRTERRNVFNGGHPRLDRAAFLADVVSTLTAFYPAGRPGGVPNAAQATVLANLLLPDVLVFQLGNPTGYGTPVVVNATTFIGNGRRLSEDVISTNVQVLADDDLPAAFGGGPNPPALVTQNVRDDNGTSLTDGSIDPPFPRGNGAPVTGTARAIAFPYIGARNPNPTAVPGAPPPP